MPLSTRAADACGPWRAGPARRASRKLLERIIEFVRLLDHEPCEYNQEQARVNCYDGKQALIRSFPSKVGVRPTRYPNPPTHIPGAYPRETGCAQ